MANLNIMVKINNLSKKIFCFDIDNTICKTRESEYSKSIPIKKNIKIINKLFEDGHFIKIFTSRYMGRTNSNSKKAHKLGYFKTFNQLKKWGLKFNELIMGKPRYDIFIDDKNINFSKNWSCILRKKFLIK
tara:strand:- start:3474 stop:3866 length:393 start_codon:yes stop_codon:yes gene_type:complete